MILHINLCLTDSHVNDTIHFRPSFQEEIQNYRRATMELQASINSGWDREKGLEYLKTKYLHQSVHLIHVFYLTPQHCH